MRELRDAILRPFRALPGWINGSRGAPAPPSRVGPASLAPSMTLRAIIERRAAGVRCLWCDDAFGWPDHIRVRRMRLRAFFDRQRWIHYRVDDAEQPAPIAIATAIPITAASR